MKIFWQHFKCKLKLKNLLSAVCNCFLEIARRAENAVCYAANEEQNNDLFESKIKKMEDHAWLPIQKKCCLNNNIKLFIG